MKTAADVLHRKAARNIAEQRIKKRPRADLPARAVGKKIEWIGSFVGGFVTGHLQLDGRLRFIVNRGAYPHEGRNGVKQATTARRARRMDFAVDHLQDNLEAAGIE